MKKTLAVIMTIVMLFSSVGLSVSAVDSDASDKAVLDADEIVIVLAEVIHSAFGGILAKIDKKCPLCHSLHIPPEVAEVENNCKLIVNGKDITEGNYVKIDYENQQAEIPVLAICRELGADIKWIGKIAIISYNDKMQIVDTTVSDFGLLILPGSSKAVRKMSGGDAIIEDDSFSWYFIRGMMEVEYVIDYEAATISVYTIE